MTILSVRNALMFVLLLFVSGSLFAQNCGPPPIFVSGFEGDAFPTYNDPGISGPTDDGRNFTRVQSTGLDWLDLTVTSNFSTNEITIRLNEVSDELFGLRYATRAETEGLLGSYEISLSGETPGTDAGLAFIRNFGLNRIIGNIYLTTGLWVFNPELSQLRSVNYNCDENTTSTGQGGALPTTKSSSYGNFLVRPMPPVGVTTYNDAAISGPTDDGMNFTRIDSQRLDWLDPTITLNLSINEVAIRLNQPSDELFGLRYATLDEINELLALYGLSTAGEVPGSDTGMAFIGNFGRSEKVGDITRLTALWNHLPELAQSKIVSYNLNEKTTTVVQGGHLPSTKEPTYGSFLVRPRPPVGVTTYNDAAISGPTDDGMNFTRIETQGLDWLDLTITLNLSTEAVATRLGNASDELFGLRYATSSEINELLALYGMPSVGEVSGSDAGMTFIGTFGRSPQIGDVTRITASWPINPELSQIKAVSYILNDQTTRTGQGGSNPSTASGNIGNFLVRPVPPPVVQ